MRRGPTPCIPATGSSPRAPSSPRRSRRAGLVVDRPAAGRAPGRRRQARGEADRAPGRRARRRDRRARRDRAARCSSRPRRAAADAACASCARRVELEQALAAARQRGARGLRRRDGLLRALSSSTPRHVEVQLLADDARHRPRPRRARVLDPAPPPEGARGVALAGASTSELRAAARRLRGARSRRAIGYRGAGTAEFLVSGGEYPLPRAERADPGRAPGDRARHRQRPRRRPDPRSRVGERDLGGGQRRAGHAIEVRLYAEDPRTFLPQAGRIDRLRLPGWRPRRRRRRGGRRDRHALRPDDREADRPRRHDATGRSRRSARRSPRPRSTGLVTNLPFLRWLVAHPAFRAGETTTDFLTRYPPLSPAPRVLAAGAVARALSAQPAAAGSWRRRPSVDDPEHVHGGGEVADEVTAPMPGTVISVLVAPGEQVARPRSARRSSRR